MTRIFAALLIGSALFGASTRVAAQDPSDHGRVPSLALNIDPATPHYSFASSVDPVAMVYGRFGAQLDFAPHRMHSMAVTPFYRRYKGKNGVGLDAAYHFRPMARGVHGIFLGPSAGMWIARTNPTTTRVFRVGAEAGYAHVWGGLYIAAGGGVDYRWRFGDTNTRGLNPVVRVHLGYAWM